MRELFQDQLAKGLHPGAALAVYRHGNLVLDLVGGQANDETGKPVTQDTMFVLFSSTKPLAASCLYILWERGKFQWDDPVSKYWPGFAQNGKEAVTIRHILNHQGGFPDTPPEITLEQWSDWDAIVRALEQTRPIYQPGTVLAYHARNFGWMIAELVQRIDGRPFRQFFQEELTVPLGMSDTYVGLPEDLEDRVSRLHARKIATAPARFTPTTSRRRTGRCNRRAAEFHGPRPGQILCHDAGSRLLEGTRILAPETVAEVTKVQIEALDVTNDREVRRSLGLVVGDPRSAPDDPATSTTFGHGGAGTSIGWADPDSGLAMAYITNGYRSDVTNFPGLPQSAGPSATPARKSQATRYSPFGTGGAGRLAGVYAAVSDCRTGSIYQCRFRYQTLTPYAYPLPRPSV